MLVNPLGMNVKDNPLISSPYIQAEFSGVGVVPPSPQKDLVTEGGVFILTEGMLEITTE